MPVAACFQISWALICRYCIWWGVTIAGAGFTGVYEPWIVAFLPHSER